MLCKGNKITSVLIGLCLLTLGAAPAFGAGILTAKSSDVQPIQIRDHHVDVAINNGFARTEVIQTFYNPNDADLEAVYSFPLPKSASLSEVTIYSGEREIHGEVLAKEQARQVYEEEKSKGNDAGLAEKNEFYTFEFSVYPVRAKDQTRIRFLYYQPLEIDTGVGRYLYPLEEGGTDEAALNFWTGNDKVEDFFSVNVELRSAWPVDQVRVPGYEAAAQIEQKGDGHYIVKLEQQSVNLNRDFILYYRLQENLPGRVEVIPYRADPGKPGTFMMVVTPGMDLKPLNRGADYVFVLDVSGSMQTKIHTLASGVSRALGEMSGQDRFRIITFNSSASDLTRGWENAFPDKVKHYIDEIMNLDANGSTNLYAGLELALNSLDDDRATSIVLVTDGVTNTGVVDPSGFHKLMKNYDVRVFGFLMGNSANWPLMRIVCESSGGFYAGVSNADDIIGQIMLAKGKILYECLHAAEWKISGVKIFDATKEHVGKVYRGQQLVFFGRYDEGGRAKVTLTGSMTGEDKTYTTEFDFPKVDTDYPEIERLWALDRIEHLEYLADIGQMPAGESQTAVRDLGIAYQLVTDETSMVVLCDEAFAERGIDRKNQRRVERERQARQQRIQKPRNHRKDKDQPMFSRPAPSSGGGGGIGAFDPFSAGIALGAALLAGCAARRVRRKRDGESR